MASLTPQNAKFLIANMVVRQSDWPGFIKGGDKYFEGNVCSGVIFCTRGISVVVYF
ncbi:hypothetical protein PSAC2689_70357 [Paraburkholderia sacchari]